MYTFYVTKYFSCTHHCRKFTADKTGDEDDYDAKLKQKKNKKMENESRKKSYASQKRKYVTFHFDDENANKQESYSKKNKSLYPAE